MKKETGAVMPTEKDSQFVQFIYDQTRNGKLHWESTADATQFVIGFRGKYKVTVDKNVDEDTENQYFYLTLRDDSERELLTIFSARLPIVKDLYYLAERNALNVDAAIDEIMSAQDGPDDQPEPENPITDDDLPF